MRPLTWALKEVDPVGLHRQPGNLGIVKIIRYIRSDMYSASAKKNLAGRCPPLANGALCLNTPKHNVKSGPGGDRH